MQKDNLSITPGFHVTVHGTDINLNEASDVVVRIQRPDSSVVERVGYPVGGQRLELALHRDDLAIEGSYMGEVELKLDGKIHSFSPAFELIRVLPEPSNA